MRLAKSTIVAIVVAGGFSLTAYVMGQGQGAAGAAPSTGMNPAGPAVNGQSLQGQPAPQTTIGPTTQKTPGPIAQTSGGPVTGTSRSATSAKTKTKHSSARQATTSPTTSPKMTAPPTA